MTHAFFSPGQTGSRLDDPLDKRTTARVWLPLGLALGHFFQRLVQQQATVPSELAVVGGQCRSSQEWCQSELADPLEQLPISTCDV